MLVVLSTVGKPAGDPLAGFKVRFRPPENVKLFGSVPMFLSVPLLLTLLIVSDITTLCRVPVVGLNWSKDGVLVKFVDRWVYDVLSVQLKVADVQVSPASAALGARSAKALPRASVLADVSRVNFICGILHSDLS
jgi:hypothetical protein